MLDNKLIVKGALSLKILYQSSLSESIPECMEYSILLQSNAGLLGNQR